jgi:hypothetical protein
MNSSARRYRIEKWFWLAMVGPTVLWFGSFTLYVSLLSVYALVISAAAAEQAAEAAEKVDGERSR